MNDLSSRAETHVGTSKGHPPAGATPSVTELLRRAESVRTTLVFAAIALVVALTVVVQSNAARRAAQQRPVVVTGEQPAPNDGAEGHGAPPAASASTGVSR